MDNISALILVGGRGKRLEALTEGRTKPYVSFLGKYRIIDFVLSSLSNSHITDIGILTQYEPYDLIKYIGNGGAFDLDAFGKGISFLTPYVNEGQQLVVQKGTAHACLTQIEFIKKSRSKYFLILSGDQIYKINFKDVLDEHIKNNANLTILTNVYPKEDELSRFGIIEADENNKILSFEEKPAHPKSNQISMGIYLFNKDFLIKYIEQAEKYIDFGKDLIPHILENEDGIYAYPYKGKFFDVGTPVGYFDASMYYLDHPEEISPHLDQQKIYSKPLYYTPLYIGEEAKVKSSYVAEGAKVYGSVRHSIISYCDVIGEGSSIHSSIVLPDTVIGKNVKLKNAIINEKVKIKDNMVLRFEEPTLVDTNYEGVEPNE